MPRIYPTFGAALARLPRLPDLLTTANLACGVASILLASQGQLTIACGLVFLAALFDVLDGLVARALGGGGELGKQLDSLADMVSFGVAPAFLAYLQASSLSGTGAGWTIYPPLSALQTPPALPNLIYVLGAVGLGVASCWRLVKFNLDTRQVSGFLGLPTPANGLFWTSLVLGLSYPAAPAVGNGPWVEMIQDVSRTILGTPAMLVVSLLMAILMLSSLPLPSLKFKHYRWKGNEVIYCLLLAALCLLALYGVLAVPLILIIYLLSPLWGRLFPKTP